MSVLKSRRIPRSCVSGEEGGRLYYVKIETKSVELKRVST